jgi:hypothetical protein
VEMQKQLAGLGLFAALMLMIGTAQAAPITVTVTASLTHDGTGLVGPVGTELSLDFLLDDATPNETTPPNYVASGGVGTVSSFLIVPVAGTVDWIIASTRGTWWSTAGVLDAEGFLLPFTLNINGTGLTPGQIIPDFVGPVAGGSLSVDVGAVVPGETVEATITGVKTTFGPVPSVPSLSAPALVLLWTILAGAGCTVLRYARRRSRCSSGATEGPSS